MTTRIVEGVLAAVFFLASTFFLYYCIRLAIVWSRNIGRPAGGAYIGAVVFPIAVVVFGWLSRQCLRRASGTARKVAI